MEALYFLKFWRPTSHKDSQPPPPPSSGNTNITKISNPDDGFDQGEDSFFELELLTVPDFYSHETKNYSNSININSPPDKDSNRFDSEVDTSPNMANKAPKFLQPTLSLSRSPTDHRLSKRKILPIEPISSKPHSPITLLKSAPTFRVLMFKKSKSLALRTEKAGETDFDGGFDAGMITKDKRQEGKLLTVRFRVEESANASIFTRGKSLRKYISVKDVPLSDDSSKRFAKNVIQKYLKLMKPLYIKISKKQSEKMAFSGELSMASSPSSSPAASSPKKEKRGNIQAGIRVVTRHLRKSKSSSAMNVVLPSSSVVSRKDDSLQMQQDGIQSAILHCKKSFSSTRGSSSLSSDPLYEQSMTLPRTSMEDNAIKYY